MKDVELNPLRKGDTFPNKEIVMLRIAEEANLFGIRIQTRRSDLFQLQVYGVGGDPFHVHANYCSAKSTWVVTACEVRIGRAKYVPRKGGGAAGDDEVLLVSNKMIDPHDYAGRPKENETFTDDIFDGVVGKEGNADYDDDGDDSDDEDDEVEKKQSRKVV